MEKNKENNFVVESEINLFVKISRLKNLVSFTSRVNKIYVFYLL